MIHCQQNINKCLCYSLQVWAIYMYLNKPLNLKSETLCFFETSENICLKTVKLFVKQLQKEQNTCYTLGHIHDS
jgi:hypothetical protein